jgi:hypothetical protein
MARREQSQEQGQPADEEQGPLEIALVGDLTDNESDLTERILGIEPGGECTIYFEIGRAHV